MTEKTVRREPKKVIDKGFNDTEYARIVANVKRILELWTLDARFHNAYEQDPERTLAETGLVVDPETIRLLLDDDAIKEMKAALKDGTLAVEDLPNDFRLYKAFIKEKIDSRDLLRNDLCAPDEPRFKAWRARQEKRCMLEFGVHALSMIQAPLMFELSEGCSVGCPFCGVASKKLAGVFRYTDEHARLWRDVLGRMHALMGDAAGSGAIYYDCEGLDTPDYEKFLADFFAEFGIVPQTTTAVSTRNIERTRALLQYGNENDPHIDRFSVLNPAMRDELFATFSPEELLLVELLPQFPEAPDCHLAEVGRGHPEEWGDEVGSTIACTSGFVVNMQEQSVRLMTPYVSCRTHPTGEWILEKAPFATADDLEGAIKRMIARYMPERFELGGPCKASCEFRLEQKEEKVWVSGHGAGFGLMETPFGQETLDCLRAMLGEGERTGYGILDVLPEGADIAHAILLLKALWEHGLIDQTEN